MSNKSKIKTYKFEDVLDKELRVEEFKLEYDALEEEFTLAKEVLRLRIASGMSQTQLARKAGTSQPAIARLESGNYKNLSLSFIRRVASALEAVPDIRLRSLRTIRPRKRL